MKEIKFFRPEINPVGQIYIPLKKGGFTIVYYYAAGDKIFIDRNSYILMPEYSYVVRQCNFPRNFYIATYEEIKCSINQII